ncbi:hypothetical protein MMC19_001516 [Ptychographa xylographoides]|nr:hypothetical protein [Ptychographa xylographoides]
MSIDDDAVLYMTYKHRRRRLEELITIIPGRASLVSQQYIDFSNGNAPQRLLELLCAVFVQRWEGCVMKPVDEPYTSLGCQTGEKYRSCWVKLKKDYIPGLGDTAELAIVGAGYDSKEAQRSGISGLPWNVFHMGCLLNKDDVLRTGAIPKFKVLDSFNTMITRENMQDLCNRGRLCAENIASLRFGTKLDILPRPFHLHKMDVVFTKPFVFEVKGSGFDKPPNCDYFVLRFPRLVKIHWDRDLRDTVSFNELQAMAAEAMNAPEGDLLSEIADWTVKLKSSERRKINDKCWWKDTSQELNSSSDLDLEPSTWFGSSKRNGGALTMNPFIHIDTSETISSYRSIGDGEMELHLVSSCSASLPDNASILPYPPERRERLPSGDKSTKTNETIIESFINPRTSFSSSPEQDDPTLSEDWLERRKKRPRGMSAEPSPPAKLRRRTPASNAMSLTTDGLAIPPSARTPRSALKELINYAQESPSTPGSLRDRSYPASRPSRHFSGTEFPKRTIKTHAQQLATQASDRSPPLSLLTKSPPISNATASPSRPVADHTTTSATRPTHHSSHIPQNPIHPPNFTTTLTIIAPCIANMPYLTADLLPSLGATVCDPFEPNNIFLRDRPLPQTPKGIIVLIESYHDGPSAEFLRRLVPLVEMGDGGRTVEIWDWRIVEVVGAMGRNPMGGRAGRGGGEEAKRTEREARKWFVGRMEKDGERKTLVVWKNGDVSRCSSVAEESEGEKKL